MIDHSTCNLYRNELHCASFFRVLSFPLAAITAQAVRGCLIWHMLSKAQLKCYNRQFSPHIFIKFVTGHCNLYRPKRDRIYFCMLQHKIYSFRRSCLSWARLVLFGLFVHPFSHIRNIGHVNYRLQFTTQLIIYGYPHNTI